VQQRDRQVVEEAVGGADEGAAGRRDLGADGVFVVGGFPRVDLAGGDGVDDGDPDGAVADGDVSAPPTYLMRGERRAPPGMASTTCPPSTTRAAWE
jgi:hypothetical protein